LRNVQLERGFPVDDERFGIPDAHEVKLQALHAIATTLPEYAEHLRGKDLLIFKAPAQCEFIIGDNPVSMDNHRDYGFKGNIGLATHQQAPYSRTVGHRSGGGDAHGDGARP
jgi:hypothetical protein